MNNVKQFKKYCHGMNVIPPPPPFLIVVNNIIKQIPLSFMIVGCLKKAN